mmetsp:Transcript_10872/g.10779  ORF Transcript_10872/g.10779 Transcript_10872/m.10779 type:complete len:243 (+) Transcript_10872:47-775(+)
MLDSNLKSWLLEVNSTPSYNTDSPLDKQIKGDLIRDTFKILGVSQQDRRIVKTMEKYEKKKRENNTEEEQLKLEEDSKAFYQKCLAKKINHEENNLGGFEKIFPPKDEAKMKTYTEIMKKATSLFIESTGTKPKNVQKDKKDQKLASKIDKKGKDHLISPFKKIYNHSKDMGKLKIKNKSKSAVQTTVKKRLDSCENRAQKDNFVKETIIDKDFPAEEICFSTYKKDKFRELHSPIGLHDRN